MRPKRPHIATLDQIRIRRTSEGAVIEYLDPAILPVVISVGPDADRLSDAELLDHHNTHLREAEALTKGRQHVVVEIPPGRRQIEYSLSSGQWVPRGGVLRCLIDENPSDRQPVIHVDDHELSWQDFGRLLLTYAGWGVRVTFVPDDQTIETAVVEVRDLADGQPAHEWR